MKLYALICFSACFLIVAAWPPIPPPFTPVMGYDIPGSDLGGMPITLSLPYIDQCIQICNSTANARAWAYGLPNCGGTIAALCWCKFTAGPSDPNPCRAYGLLNTRPCQLETPWTNKVDPQNPLPDFPRPQLTRQLPWKNLNGLWQFQPASLNEKIPFGTTLNETVLVPFPVESCLSGIGKNYMYLFYRIVFRAPFTSGRTILHFGAVDWQASVYINKRFLGTHTGGYSSFSFDITPFITPQNNELFLYVYDPSDFGSQPFGKQRISAITQPGGDTYTPSSGIWQTVWLENTPMTYIQKVKFTYDSLTSVTVNVTSNLPNQHIFYQVQDQGSTVTTGTGTTDSPLKITIPNTKLWSPTSPFLYNLTVYMGGEDLVYAYFGVRTVSVGKDSRGTTRPMINGQFTFLAGWLDQSWWPDGLYTAPTDDALRSDLLAVLKYGYNFVRLHQKVNPQRWYYYTDVLGIIVQQDMVQHYGDQHGVVPNHTYYWDDLKAMIDDVGSHPSIIQWTAFNEGDMVSHFDPPKVVDWIEAYDPTRFVDTDSGGPANNLYIADVNDIHTYPVPGDPKPSNTQFAEVGEYGGLGAFVSDHMWAEGLCESYMTLPNTTAFADLYIQYANLILSNKKDISIAVYTQITDVELECDGYLNFDRSPKFSSADAYRVYQANQNLINTPV